MIRYSPALKALLDATSTQKDWCAALISAMGNSIKFTCKRVANASTADDAVFINGTTFYAASIIGTPSVRGSTVVDFGYAKNPTVKAAADLTAGKSVLRIEGATDMWFEGTFGLLNQVRDFRVRISPTAKMGFALGKISISAPPNLRSGTGPQAPEENADTTKFVRIDDMTVPGFPRAVGTIPFDDRQTDFVFEDAEMAAEIGDVRVTQSTKSIVYGDVEFGILRLDMDKKINAEAEVTLEQGLVCAKPYNNWPTYPFMDTFDATRAAIYPRAFRVVLLRGDMSIKKILQMHDGLPINDPSLSEFYDENNRCRPRWNTGMMLPWQSHRTKPSSNFAKYFNGMEPDSVRHSQAKKGASCNAASPQVTQGGQANSCLHINAAPRWPMKKSTVYGGSAENLAEDPQDDPFLFKPTEYSGGPVAQAVGWDYEPGSISCTDWLAHWGGPRHDRSVVWHTLAMYATEPNGTRRKHNVPWRDMVDAYGMAMFNLAHHWVQDVRTFAPVPKKMALEGFVQSINARYTGRLIDVPGTTTRSVDVEGIGYGGIWSVRLRSGQPTWQGFQQDHLHNSMAPGMMTIFFNSVMHVVSQGHRFVGSAACFPSRGWRSNVDAKTYWMTREHAWRWLQYLVSWKVGSKHPLGYLSQRDIEDKLQVEMERCYADIYVPTKIDNNPDIYYAGLRKRGIHMLAVTSSDGITNSLGAGHDTKTFYLGHLLVLMRQLGLMKVMRAKSEKCRVVFDFLIECLDRYSIDSFYHTNGRAFHGVATGSQTWAVGSQPPVPYTWQEYTANLLPVDPVMDFTTKSDGSVSTEISAFQGATMHLVTQWILARPTYFPEYPHPLLGDTVTMVRAQYQKVTDQVAARTTDAGRGLSDWGIRWAPHGALAVPSVLGEI